MKIKAICRRCGREFFIQQAVENGGRCPWDGEPLQPDYAAVLVEALREADEAGNRLEESLDTIADLHPALILDKESILSTLRADLERLEGMQAAR